MIIKSRQKVIIIINLFRQLRITAALHLLKRIMGCYNKPVFCRILCSEVRSVFHRKANVNHYHSKNRLQLQKGRKTKWWVQFSNYDFIIAEIFKTSAKKALETD